MIMKIYKHNKELINTYIILINYFNIYNKIILIKLYNFKNNII